MASKDSFDPGRLCRVTVLHRIAVGANEIDIARREIGLSKSTLDCACDRVSGFVYLPEVRPLIGAACAQNLCVCWSRSGLRQLLGFHGQHRRAFGEDKPRTQQIEWSTCLLCGALPFGEHADRMENAQHELRERSFGRSSNDCSSIPSSDLLGCPPDRI